MKRRVKMKTINALKTDIPSYYIVKKQNPPPERAKAIPEEESTQKAPRRRVPILTFIQHNADTKLMVAKYAKKHITRKASNRYAIPFHTVSRWLTKYNKYGDDAFILEEKEKKGGSVGNRTQEQALKVEEIKEEEVSNKTIRNTNTTNTNGNTNTFTHNRRSTNTERNEISNGETNTNTNNNTNNTHRDSELTNTNIKENNTTGANSDPPEKEASEISNIRDTIYTAYTNNNTNYNRSTINTLNPSCIPNDVTKSHLRLSIDASKLPTSVLGWEKVNLISPSLRLWAAQEGINKGSRKTAELVGVSEESVHRWMAAYRTMGKEAHLFKTNVKRYCGAVNQGRGRGINIYSVEAKKEIIDKALIDGRTKVAYEHGISPNTITQWKNRLNYPVKQEIPLPYWYDNTTRKREPHCPVFYESDTDSNPRMKDDSSESNNDDYL